MLQTIKEAQANAQSVNVLESYQRLVELQKQMIQLAQQNERAKLECAELRELVATEVIARMDSRRSPRPKTNKALKQSPRTAVTKSNLVSLIIKEPSTC
jgi:regulator of replication initiation timing